MRYADGGAFRMALEERLRAEALASGTALSRLRKTVAFDRLLARLLVGAPDAWVLKGGLALQVRFADRARTTKDMDLHTRETATRAVDLLASCALVNAGDFFSFAVQRPSLVAGEGSRCVVEARLDGRVFERFHVNLGVEERAVGVSTCGPVTCLLGFAEIQPVEFPCLPLEQHVAEKVHALTRPRGSRENSRVKDLADVVLLSETSLLSAAGLREALDVTFAVAATHSIPPSLPAVPGRWAPPYRALAKDLALRADTIGAGVAAAKRLVDPILQGRSTGDWSPEEAGWRE